MSKSIKLRFKSKTYLFLLLIFIVQLSNLRIVYSSDEEEVAPQVEQKHEPSPQDIKYVSPKLKPDGIYLFENFDDEQQFTEKWISSSDPKYEGQWKLESGSDRPPADKQLVLPLKARHYAISSKLNEQFKFTDNKSLVVQYEVQFRDKLDCGGAYIKLLRQKAINDLKTLTDKTPFTIMFGPDKCGNQHKLHFIIQYLNPKTNEYEEKHWERAAQISPLMSIFSDQKHHLFKFVLEPNDQFEIFLDDVSVGSGNLLEDLKPAINPPKEIVDPNDSKPEDWDERAEIDDPNAKKPDDWDEDAPKTIEDTSAVKPSDWLEDEPKYVPDPNAKKPDDWEQDDGEWEAPLVENPACVKASGCGEWKPPMVDNPAYKGKWRPPKIANPNYKGKWAPRMIPNPDHFFDENPFSTLDSIGAIAFELWSMADNIAFDNIIISSDKEQASLLKLLTWQDKKYEADATSSSLLTRALHRLRTNPWLWIVVVLGIALPLVLFIAFCCDTKRGRKSGDDAAKRKKADESRPDDKPQNESEDEDKDDEEEEDDQDDEEAEDDVDEESNNNGSSDNLKKASVRHRKAKK